MQDCEKVIALSIHVHGKKVGMTDAGLRYRLQVKELKDALDSIKERHESRGQPVFVREFLFRANLSAENPSKVFLDRTGLISPVVVDYHPEQGIAKIPVAQADRDRIQHFVGDSKNVGVYLVSHFNEKTRLFSRAMPGMALGQFLVDLEFKFGKLCVPSCSAARDDALPIFELATPLFSASQPVIAAYTIPISFLTKDNLEKDPTLRNLEKPIGKKVFQPGRTFTEPKLTKEKLSIADKDDYKIVLKPDVEKGMYVRGTKADYSSNKELPSAPEENVTVTDSSRQTSVGTGDEPPIQSPSTTPPKKRSI